jgi:hypothetical protein
MFSLLKRRFALSILLLELAAMAQQPKLLAPHRPIAPRVAASKQRALPPAKPGSLVGGLWMTDANTKSQIYLRNLVETSAVTATPVLYLSNGVRYALDPVTIAPSGTKVVDVNAALQSKGVAPFATLRG